MRLSVKERDGIFRLIHGDDQVTDTEQIKRSLDGLTTRFDQIDAKFDQIDARFDQIDAKFESVDVRFDRVEERLSNVEDNMATKMDLAQTRVSLEEGQRLILEVVRGHTDQLAAIPPALTALDRRVTALESTKRDD